MSYFYRRKSGPLDQGTLSSSSIRKVESLAFCEVSKCIRLAEWRLGYNGQSVRLCPVHTMATMKNFRR